MSDRDETLNILYPSSVILAGLAWIATVITLGTLNHSLYAGLLAGLSCAVYVAGYIRYMDLNCERDSPEKHRKWLSTCAVTFLISAGFAINSLVITRFNFWWVWIVLALIQIPPYVFDRMISKKVEREYEEKQKERYGEDWREGISREQRLKAAAQSTFVSEFADALGLKVLDSRTDHERQSIQSARQSADLPKCSSCGKEIPPTETTIGQDIRRGGGVVFGGQNLDETLYKGTISRSCGRIFCDSCHDFSQKGYSCPSCGNPISPLFADYLRSR